MTAWIRSVDTNPMTWPSRLCGRRLQAEDHAFAKQATAVCLLYTDHLRAGNPVRAKGWWVRLIPERPGDPAAFEGDEMGGDGLGEVHNVAYDPAILALPAAERGVAYLGWVQACMLAFADSFGWDKEPLAAAYEACLRDGCRYELRGKPKSSADRKLKAYVEFEVDAEGDGWCWVVVTDRDGGVVAVSDRYDSLPESAPARRMLESLRWEGDTVVWRPWPAEEVPNGLAGIANFAVRHRADG